MAKIKRPLPSNIELAPTLSARVFQIREYRNMTVRDLGKQTRLGPKRIEDIEAGLETWLSSPIRQRLANALSIEPYLLKEVEIKPMLSIHPELEDIPGELYENLQALILSG